MIHPTAIIHPTALISRNVSIGAGTYIGPYCVIGEPPEHRDYFLKESSIVVIGMNCTITGHVTIDAGTEGPTVVSDNVWLMKHSHVSHDATIGDGSVISCGAKIGGHAIIGVQVNIGLNAVIHQRKEIPNNCMIGMGAVITKGLQMEPNCKYAGNPARLLGPNTKP